ncbi:hypothetical protein N9783_02080 [Planktomarina temperata]|nr:hypothetical protein [Planktomarina temperata]
MKWFAIVLSFTFIGTTILADVRYSCVELDRISLSADGRMSPAFPGRILNFLQEGQNLTGDGVFYHDIYHVTLDGASGFRARAESEERDDLYWLDAGILFHTAIIKYRSEPVIQSQAFACMVVE